MNEKNKLTQEKGAITLYVILAMFFLLVFIIGAYIIANKKLQSQYESIKTEKKVYENNESGNTAGNSIPIYTDEQLLSVGNGEDIYIYQANNTYTFGPSSNYVLKDSIKIQANYDNYISKQTILTNLQKISIENNNNDNNKYKNIIEFQDGTYIYYDKYDESQSVNNWIVVGATTANQISASNYSNYVDCGIDLNNDNNTGNDWRILFNDKKNIYLIASDYVEIDGKTPKTKANNDSFNSNSGKGIQFNSNIITDYTGSSEINSNSALSGAIIKYYNWFNANNNSTNNNAKICSYLLDTTRWTAIINNQNKSYIKYVSGAPTIEMITKSYNEKNPNSAQIQTRLGTNGYDIKLSTDNSYGYQINSALSTNDTFYNPTNTSGIVGMWLSSPSNFTNNSDNIFALNGTSIKSIPYTYTDTNALGLRPIICLNSDVKLTFIGQDTWTVNNN